jgi:predicted GNAT family acetyltransferase
MANEKSIEKQVSGREGRYAGRMAGAEGEAELTFTIRSSSLISADHTEVPDSMRGTGMGLALVEHMIADARKSGMKIMPLCPYVAAQFKKHPDWQDVMAAAH